MSHPYPSRRRQRLAALLLLLALPSVASAKGPREPWARTQYDNADRLREALNGRPAGERTRRDYQRLIDAYRRIYYRAPVSGKADPSVVAVAELLAEMGHQFDDRKLLRSAIRQYEFLRREYPGSRYRAEALFTIGQIYKDDLQDRAHARATFQDFLKRYPNNHLVEEARAAIAEMAPKAGRKEAVEEGSGQDADDQARDSSHPQRDQLPRVTAIRHWSTPDYTRVAIDLEDEVRYDSQRIGHPDRIYFDLHDTRLAPVLVAKTLEVEDGFLRKVRVAQYKPGQTRIVLEVSELSQYSAFLLPNPYRLIIDIHGQQPARTQTATAKMPAAPLPPAAAKSVAAPLGPSPLKDAPQATARKAAAQPVIPASAVGEVAWKDTAPLKPYPAPQATASVKPVARVPAAARMASAAVPKVIVEEDDADEQGTQAKPEAPPAAKEAIPPATTPAANRQRRKGKSQEAEPEVVAREARPTASGDRSLIRALGLKIGKIVIDPGHGGHDTGTIGPRGLEEKDLVLEVAQRLGRLLENRMGADVVYTRDDDTFVPLETRTAVANREQADLFVSIHANSSHDSAARGVETYYLNFTSSTDALEVAARENAVSDKSIHQLQDLVKKIALKEKTEESREFAVEVQRALYSGLSSKSPAIRNRGVKKAPFIVLIGANMPSILAEISFVSNPADERKLRTQEYRQRIAESLYRGISKYVSGLSGVKVASTLPKSSGQ